MSHEANTIYTEHMIESIEDLLRVPYCIFDRENDIGKFKILDKAPGTNAKAAIRIYLELKNFLGD